jgi:hypothetical protein
MGDLACYAMYLLGLVAVLAVLAGCGGAGVPSEEESAAGPATAAPVQALAEGAGACSITWARLEHGAQNRIGAYRLTFEVKNDASIPLYDV